jgi:hypothetical protein
MYEILAHACKTGDLKPLKNVVPDYTIESWSIVDLTHTAIINNHPQIVYWLMATYPLIFNLQPTLTMLTSYIMYYHESNCWNLIFGQLPAIYYNGVVTSFIRRIFIRENIEYAREGLTYVMKARLILYIESEYLF